MSSRTGKTMTELVHATTSSNYFLQPIATTKSEETNRTQPSPPPLIDQKKRVSPGKREPLSKCHSFLLANATYLLLLVSGRKQGQPTTSEISIYGFRAKANPIFALFSTALASTSPDIVKRDLGRHSCWMRALTFPLLLTRAFTVVKGSRA